MRPTVTAVPSNQEYGQKKDWAAESKRSKAKIGYGQHSGIAPLSRLNRFSFQRRITYRSTFGEEYSYVFERYAIFSLFSSLIRRNSTTAG